MRATRSARARPRSPKPWMSAGSAWRWSASSARRRNLGIDAAVDDELAEREREDRLVAEQEAELVVGADFLHGGLLDDVPVIVRDLPHREQFAEEREEIAARILEAVIAQRIEDVEAHVAAERAARIGGVPEERVGQRLAGAGVRVLAREILLPGIDGHCAVIPRIRACRPRRAWPSAPRRASPAPLPSSPRAE